MQFKFQLKEWLEMRAWLPWKIKCLTQGSPGFKRHFGYKSLENQCICLKIGLYLGHRSSCSTTGTAFLLTMNRFRWGTFWPLCFLFNVEKWISNVPEQWTPIHVFTVPLYFQLCMKMSNNLTPRKVFVVKMILCACFSQNWYRFDQGSYI